MRRYLSNDLSLEQSLDEAHLLQVKMINYCCCGWIVPFGRHIETSKHLLNRSGLIKCVSWVIYNVMLKIYSIVMRDWDTVFKYANTSVTLLWLKRQSRLADWGMWSVKTSAWSFKFQFVIYCFHINEQQKDNQMLLWHAILYITHIDFDDAYKTYFTIFI